MSSNIRLNRTCNFCGKSYVAKTTVTKYCSLPCAQKAYKLAKRQEKLDSISVPILKKSEQTKKIPPNDLKDKEFLNVSEVARLLGYSRQAVYLMIKTGRLRAVSLSKKKTIIKRSAIDELFEKKPETTPLPAPAIRKVEYDDWYCMKEIQEIFGISEKALYDLIKRNGIVKKRIGWYCFAPKIEIDKYLKS